MFIFRHVTLPVVACLLLAVTVPYVIAAGVVPIIGQYEWNFVFMSGAGLLKDRIQGSKLTS